MSMNYFEEASRDAKILAKRISADDYKNLKTYWQNRSFFPIASMLRRYGIEFKGLTHLESLVSELIEAKEAEAKL